MFLTANSATKASTAMAARGTANTLCQPNEVTSAPHTVGARAGPNVITQPPMARNVPSLRFGATTRTVFIMSGMKMPEPAACTRRAAMSSSKLEANNPMSEPTSVNAAAAKYRGRSLKRRYMNAMHMTTMVATIM